MLWSICGQTHEFEIRVTRQRTRAGNLTICYSEKQIDVSFNASVLLLTMNLSEREREIRQSVIVENKLMSVLMRLFSY